MKSAVYIIRNIETGHVYVGSTTNLRARVRNHFGELRRGVHDNARMQAAFVQYGRAAFHVVSVPVPEVDLLATEQAWIEYCRAADGRFGYNIAPNAGSVRGVRRTEAFKRAAAERLIGSQRPQTPQWRAAIAAGARRFWESPESDAARAARSAASKRTPRTAEWRAAISRANKGRACPTKGMPLSEAHRQAIAEAQRRRWAERRAEQEN